MGKAAPDPRVAALLAEVERRWGRGALVRLGDAAEAAEVEVVPTGFPALDVALGVGGLPCGRISEIFGPDSSGKHALAAHLVVQCQQSEGVAAYIDLGWRLDPEQMEAQGVDFRSLLVARPRGHLQALEMAIRLARGGGIRLMIVDLQRPWDGGARSGEDRLRPSVQSLALRRLVSAVDKNGIAFVFLSGSIPPKPRSQSLAPRPDEPCYAERSEASPRGRRRPFAGAQDDTFGPQPSSGGQALRFFASVRLGMERREWIRRGRDVMGCRSLVQVAKNKLAPPLREAEVDLLFYRFPPEAPALQLLQPSREDAPQLQGRARYA